MALCTGRKWQTVVSLCGLVLLCLCLFGCRKRIPAPWSGLGLPLHEARVASGTSPSEQEVMISVTTKETPVAVCANFLRALQRKGFVLNKGQLSKKPDLVLIGQNYKIGIKCTSENGSVLVSLRKK